MAAAAIRVSVTGGTVAGEIIPAAGERIAGGVGGRNETRVLALLGKCIDAVQDCAFRLRGIRYRAGLALDDRRPAGNGVVCYELADGQAVLVDQKQEVAA